MIDRLEGTIQPYAWGDRRLIAEMQGREPTGEPEAELWFGAHPVAPSRLVSGSTLAEAVGEHPADLLGARVVERFGRFPYLLKVLAAAEPLSIQAHPSLAQAKQGFAREDEAGVAWDAPNRTYRDDNHKPELICALTDFEAKCGFRARPETVTVIDAMVDVLPTSGAPGLRSLATRVSADGDDGAVLAEVMGWLLRLTAAEAKTLVGETIEAAERLLPEIDDLGLARFGPELSWTGQLHRFHPGDIGIVVALLLNHVVLAPGEAIFLKAGNLHSYLKGCGVELMANSDNVVRGGLTVKHVDVDELVQVVDASPAPAPVQVPAGVDHTFDSPVPEFSLTRMVGPGTREIVPEGPEIVLVTSGSVAVEGDADATVTLVAGQAGFVSHHSGAYRIVSGPGAEVWRAAVGDLSL